MDSAREEARQKALEGILAAGEKDWRALAEWLKLTFPEHRQGHNRANRRKSVKARQTGKRRLL
jgi:hypothetical protein